MTDLYHMPGHLIRRLNQISVAVFSDRMAEIGVDLTPVQFAALTQIAKTPGQDQATVAGAIAYDKVTLGGVVDRLVQKGWLQRDVSPEDRRARVLSVTPRGLALLEQVTPVVQQFQSAILSGLTAQEQETLVALMAKATAAGNALSRAPLRLKEKAK